MQPVDFDVGGATTAAAGMVVSTLNVTCIMHTVYSRYTHTNYSRTPTIPYLPIYVLSKVQQLVRVLRDSASDPAAVLCAVQLLRCAALSSPDGLRLCSRCDAMEAMEELQVSPLHIFISMRIVYRILS